MNEDPKFDIDFASLSEEEKKLALLRLRTDMMTEEQKLAPDTFGCECIFLKQFVNYEMESDFPMIAKEFLKHEMDHLDEYTKYNFVSTDPMDSWPEAAYRYMILNLMMGAVHSGSEYTRKLFCSLHRTYYKREYKVLKRFHHITAEEIMDIAGDGKKKITDYDVARLLCISKMYGISVDQDCAFLYLLLDEHWENYSYRDCGFYCFPDGAMKNAAEDIKEIFGDINTMDMIDELEKNAVFSKKVLNYFCCDEDYVSLCDEENYGIEDTLTKTLAFLKECFPKRTFSKELILAYAQVYHSISALQSVSIAMADLIKATLGIPDCGEYEEHTPLFNPEKIENAGIYHSNQTSNHSRKNASSDGTKDKLFPSKGNGDDTNSLLEKSIEELREKLHMQETANRELQKQLKENRRRLAEQEEISKNFEEERKELTVLRNHLYHLTKDTEENMQISAEEMTRAISGLDIMIVGGNDNWVNKLRKIFPGWRFISPNASAAVNSMQTAKIDKAYFFTDTLGHSQYYKYMQVIRTRQIPFGYIHGVNLQANIRQIYQDFHTKNQ